MSARSSSRQSIAMLAAVVGCVALGGALSLSQRAGEAVRDAAMTAGLWGNQASPPGDLRDGRLGGEGHARSIPDERRYSGRTLDEWRAVMKALVPADPASFVFIPGLIELVRNEEVPAVTRRQAALTLGRIGRPAAEAVPLLVELLAAEERIEERTELPTAIWAVKALALFGPEARAAAPHLARLLRDESREARVRMAAIEALARIGAAHPAVIPALVDALALGPQSDAPDARRTAAEFRGLAAEALGSIGTPAASAIPALVRAADDENEVVRRHVIAALGAMREEAAPAIATLVSALAFDESPAVRDSAATALGRIGAPATPTLAHLLADREEELRLRAAGTLAEMGESARGALPALERASADDSPAVRLRAAEALWRIARNGDRAIAVAVELLASRDRQLRISASRLLVEIAPHDPRVRRTLREVVASDDPRLRRAAEETLEKIARAAN
ncbi:MAG: HEAT repeat domain-containing protein [Planctomycetaceae bacterium]